MSSKCIIFWLHGTPAVWKPDGQNDCLILWVFKNQVFFPYFMIFFFPSVGGYLASKIFTWGPTWETSRGNL